MSQIKSKNIDGSGGKSSFQLKLVEHIEEEEEGSE